MTNADETIGFRLYCDGRAFAACSNAEQRRGWIRAQHEAAESRLQDARARQAGRVALDEEPDWWLEEMAS